MEVKGSNPINYLNGENIHPIIRFFFEYTNLKRLYRQGWLQRDIPKEVVESVADHSFSIALLAYVIAEEYLPRLDSSKVMRMALMHDLGEVHAGDITPSDNVPIEKKAQAEWDSINRLFSNFTHGDNYLSLWREFEEGSSDEAVFVGEIDKLEMALQASVYEHGGFANLDDFFLSVQQRIFEPEVKKILEEILRMRE